MAFNFGVPYLQTEYFLFFISTAFVADFYEQFGFLYLSAFKGMEEVNVEA